MATTKSTTAHDTAATVETAETNGEAKTAQSATAEATTTTNPWTSLPFASGPMFDAAQQAFEIMQQAATKGWAGHGFTLPEGVRVPGVELWTKAASGSIEGANVWLAEMQSAQKQGLEQASHLIDEMARLGRAGLSWQTELAAKTTVQSLDMLRRSKQVWQAGQA